MHDKPEYLTAVNSFGLGARPDDPEHIRTRPRHWGIDQLNQAQSSLLSPPLLNSSGAYKIYHDSVVIPRLQNRRKSKRELDVSNIPELNDQVLAIYKSELAARLNHAVETPHPFIEKWVRFWSNHFTASARSLHLAALSGAHEREAIRPHVFGSFSDLLGAAVFHPAMIIYLDNDKSYGPNSPFGIREQKGYNENLAREILELHTLGVDGGYSIETIKEFALALTGWRIDKKSDSLTVFSPSLHEPGKRHILGTTFPDTGSAQAADILGFISHHPSTLRFICQKLIKHFVSSKPVPKLENDLVSVFYKTKGNLRELAKALLSHPAAWASNEWQYKTPEEYVISVARLFPEVSELRDTALPNRLGQPSLRAPSPEGWPLNGQSWINPENLLLRLSWLRRNFRHLNDKIEYSYVIETGLGGSVSNTTHQAVVNSGNRIDKLTAILTSPEFMCR